MNSNWQIFLPQCQGEPRLLQLTGGWWWWWWMVVVLWPRLNEWKEYDCFQVLLWLSAASTLLTYPLESLNQRGTRAQIRRDKLMSLNSSALLDFAWELKHHRVGHLASVERELSRIIILTGRRLVSKYRRRIESAKWGCDLNLNCCCFYLACHQCYESFFSPHSEFLYLTSGCAIASMILFIKYVSSSH